MPGKTRLRAENHRLRQMQAEHKRFKAALREINDNSQSWVHACFIAGEALKPPGAESATEGNQPNG